MQIWTPPHDAPHLLEWWRPLLLAARKAWVDQVPWPIHLDEFSLFGRVKRQGRRDIWVYEHHVSGGTICADVTGTTYRFIPTPRGPGPGQFRTCEVRHAVYGAGLPDAVEPIWYQPPREGREAVGEPPDAAAAAAAEDEEAGPRTHKHLQVFDGGGSQR